ncbi:MAG: DUF305 domain-containing protein [Anaerotignum sp.]|nr:DUF305 domain-containing protein [Anaerotignum sp.]
MQTGYRLSNVTKDYLTVYHCILDEMITGMTGAEETDSISYDFITQMIPHHRAAIEMSHNILKYTTNIPLQDLAEGIIAEQTKSIENMRKIQAICTGRNNPHRDLTLYRQRNSQIMQTMFQEMRNVRTTNQINCDFIWEMIPHHRGAVRMARNALQYSVCPELKPILETIITSQETGISQMQGLLRAMHCVG